MKFIKQLSHVSILSKDLSKVEKFYSKILGLQIIHKFINPKTKQLYGFFFSVGKNTMLEFFLTKNKTTKDSNIRHFCFEVKNINVFSERLKKKGFKQNISRGKTDKTLNFKIRDLENNIIEFHQYDRLSKIKKKLR